MTYTMRHSVTFSDEVVARLVWKSEMAHSSGYWELAPIGE
jgi:hypothetical protein